VDRRGIERSPSLVGVSSRVSAEQARLVLDWGRGFMPSFGALPDTEKRAVLRYLGYSASHLPSRSTQQFQPIKARYEFVGYERWRDSSGFPAIKPPWGTLSAIDLNTGEYRWRIRLGEHASLTARGIPITGTEQYGGPIVTAGGLLFIAATMDAKSRAFDTESGKLLWETPLPAPGYATPATYAVRGKQYVVIAAGGGKLGTPSGDAYVAFALPEISAPP
jgi:quinoprotein glucose dehydrogenase